MRVAPESTLCSAYALGVLSRQADLRKLFELFEGLPKPGDIQDLGRRSDMKPSMSRIMTIAPDSSSVPPTRWGWLNVMLVKVLREGLPIVFDNCFA